jgi:hypothetical protein
MGQAEAVRSSATAADSVVALLRSLIDYAGLFPPASLEMPAAVANYEKCLQSESSWMLGRFIVPAARLDEFQEAVGSRGNLGAEKTGWDLSVLLGPDVAADFDRMSEFNSRKPSDGSAIEVKIESVEVKVTSPADIEKISKIICPDMETYFEIPWGSGDHENVRECVKAVSACGRRAKIRTGGETADKFPPAETVVEFIEACEAAGVGFKATAGLHHPVRSRHRLTYQPDSASGMMHGFLNVFLAAAFVRSGMDSPLATELLKEQTPEAFEFDAAGVAWRGHRVSADRIVETRRNFSISFGSCSFTEPIDDLRSLHLL